MNPFEAVICSQEHTHNLPKSASRVVRTGMHITLNATRRTPHSASCVAHMISVWSANTRCVGIVVNGGHA